MPNRRTYVEEVFSNPGHIERWQNWMEEQTFAHLAWWVTLLLLWLTISTCNEMKQQRGTYIVSCTYNWSLKKGIVNNASEFLSESKSILNYFKNPLHSQEINVHRQEGKKGKEAGKSRKFYFLRHLNVSWRITSISANASLTQQEHWNSQTYTSF